MSVKRADAWVSGDRLGDGRTVVSAIAVAAPRGGYATVDVTFDDGTSTRFRPDYLADVPDRDPVDQVVLDLLADPVTAPKVREVLAVRGVSEDEVRDPTRSRDLVEPAEVVEAESVAVR